MLKNMKRKKEMKEEITTATKIFHTCIDRREKGRETSFQQHVNQDQYYGESERGCEGMDGETTLF